MSCTLFFYGSFLPIVILSVRLSLSLSKTTHVSALLPSPSLSLSLSFNMYSCICTCGTSTSLSVPNQWHQTNEATHLRPSFQLTQTLTLPKDGSSSKLIIDTLGIVRTVFRNIMPTQTSRPLATSPVGMCRFVVDTVGIGQTGNQLPFTGTAD